MSRAFVKEDTPDTTPLPDLPVSPHPNYVTPGGLDRLRVRLVARQADLATLKSRPDRLDRQPEAAAERDIRYLESRIASAISVAPPTDLAEVAFGVAVTVMDEDGIEARYEIVGEDDADAARGRIAPHSPLARALLGARVGDEVTWRRPAGLLSLEILGISNADDDPPA
ncbi:MAG: GreA/GreB family elongation factor [Paracoccaceae bacterium]